MQKVLIAGGAGFIGFHLCKLLLEKGYAVTCIDNFITGDKKNIEPFLNNPHFNFIELDISKDSANAVLQSLDVKTNINFIFHLASPASPNKKSKRSYINYPIETMLANSLGTYNLLELARLCNAKFLYASSSEIYGDPTVSPQSEKYFGNVNPNGIRSVYDEAKRFGEAMTMAFVRKHDLDCRIVRIFNTYGPCMQSDDGRVVSNFIMQSLKNSPITIYGDGSQTRSFCFVEDMIFGLELAMFKEETKGEVINLGNPNEQTVLALATMVKQLAGSESEIVLEDLPEDDPKRRKPDIEKAKTILGWEPRVSIEEGVKKTIDYFKAL